ncbi:LysR family transcriptional regulator [Candidatus Saccharibacteria bacterium]|nr:LysR family transcriptional regulator [Candidatus Saccharibacteria bacterium]
MDAYLQKFVALVEAGSYTKAAANLHISQPALSVAIAKLERTLKHILLTSAGRQGVVLSEAGKKVYAAALEHRAIDQNLRQQLATMHDQKIPLRIGMIDSVASLFCTQDELLSDLETSTDFMLSVANSTSLRAALLADKLDLAVVVADQQYDATLSTVASTSDRLVLVCSQSVHQVFQKNITKGEPLPFISYVSSSKTFETIATALSDAGIHTDVVLSSTSPEVMLAMVLRGRGAGLLPESLVQEHIAQGDLGRLAVGRTTFFVRRPLSVVKLKGRQLAPQTDAFIEFVLDAGMA